MQNSHTNESFRFTYSAKEQEEIKKIRDKYIPKEENKMEQLRRLDRGVTHKGTIYSIIIGILGSLLLGLGMSCIMVWQGIWFIPYPVYNIVTKREREKIAPEIIRLTEELIK